MADEIVKIIRIESDGAEQTVASLVNEIKNLTEAMHGVEKGTEEYSNILKDLISNQEKLGKAMKTNKQEVSAAEGSYNALVKQMAALKKQWRETTDEASRKELGNQIKDINGKLKNMDASIGNFQRNVGNYADGVKNAFGSMSGAAKGMVGPLNSVKAGLTAISSHPIVAVLTALSALLINGIAKGFKSSEENTNKLREAFSGFQAIGDAVTKMFQKLAGWIGDVANAAVNLADKLGLLGPKFKERQEMTKKQIALEKQERDAILDKAKLETEASELRAKASDEENYSISQRIEFLQQAQAKEEEQLLLEKDILEQKVAQLEAQLALTDSTGEELTKLNELKAQVVKIDGQIAASRRSTNKEIAGLNRRGLSEQQQANQARLNLEKDLLKQELDLAAKGSDERLKLAKELRKKELDIQLEGLKQKVKNRKDYEKAEQLAIAAYNNDLQKLELEHREQQMQSQQVLWDIRLVGLREGSSKYFDAYRDIVIEKINLIEAEAKKLEPKVIELMTNEGIELEAAASRVADANGQTFAQWMLTYNQLVKELGKTNDDYVKALENEINTANQIILNSTRPMSEYYKTQYNQLKEQYERMRKFNDESETDFLARKDAAWKAMLDSLSNIYQSIISENELYNKAQDVFYGEVDGTFDKLNKQLARYKDDLHTSMVGVQDIVVQDMDNIAKALANSHSFEEAFEGIVPTPEKIKEILFGDDMEEIKKLMGVFIKEGLLPESAVQSYLEALDGIGQTTKTKIEQWFTYWDDLGKAIADMMGGISDIYSISLENQKKKLEKEGKYTEQERKNLEQRYKTVQAMQIAEATINTISGAVAAFMKCQELGQPWGAILGAVQAAAVTAAGIAQIMKIKQTNPYSDSSSSLSGGDMMSATVQPTISDYQPDYTANLTGRSDTEYLNEALGKQKLFVSVVDINDAQERGRVRVAESSF